MSLPVVSPLPVPGDNGTRRLLLNSRSQQVLAGGTLFASLGHFDYPEDPECLASAQLESGVYGYLRSDGQWAVPASLQDARGFSTDGLARFRQDDRWGYLDRSGQVQIAPRFMQAHPFDEGLAAVSDDGESWYYIDTTGQVAIAGPLRRAGKFSQGLAAVQRLGESRYVYINKTGQQAFDASFDNALVFSAEGVAPASLRKKYWGLIDLRGQWRTDPVYEDIDAFNTAGLAHFSRAGDPDNYQRCEYGYLNARGQVVIDQFYSWRDEMVAGQVRTNHYGRHFLDERGQPISQEGNDWADTFSEAGATFALRNNRWGVLRADGIWQPLPEAAEPWVNHEGWIIGFDTASTLAPIRLNDGVLAYIDRDAVTHYRLVIDVQGQASLFAGDNQIWHSAAGQGLHQPAAFFTPVAGSFNQVDTGDAALEQQVAALLERADQALSRYRAGEALEDLLEDPDQADDLDEDSALPAYSRSLRLARAYLNENLNGYYEFLASQHHDVLRSDYQALFERMVALYGPSDVDPACEAIFGDLLGCGAWQIGNFWLLLTQSSETGDGDWWSEITLQARPDLDVLDAALRERMTVLSEQEDEVEEEEEEEDASHQEGSDEATLPQTREAWFDAVAESASALGHVPAAWLDQAMIDHAVSADPDALEYAPLWYLQSERLLQLVRSGLDSALHIPPISYTPEAFAEARRLYGKQSGWLDYEADHAVPESFDHNGVYDVIGALLTEDDCLRAARAGGKLDYVPQWLRTPAVIEASLQADIYNISCVAREWITPERARQAVLHDYGCLIEYIPHELLSEELCLLSVETNYLSLKAIPKDFRTLAVCMAALDKNCDCFEHVPQDIRMPLLNALIARDDPDGKGSYWHFLRAYLHLYRDDYAAVIADASLALDSMSTPEDGHYLLAWAYRLLEQKEAAAKHAAQVLHLCGSNDYHPPLDMDDDPAWLTVMSQEYIAGMDEAGLLPMLRENPALLGLVPRMRVTEAMAAVALSGDESLIEHIPKRLMNADRYAMALRQNQRHIRQVPENMLSEAACLAAVQQDGYALRNIPPDWRSEAVCIQAVSEYSSLIDAVPEAIRAGVEEKARALREARKEEDDDAADSGLSSQIDQHLMGKMLSGQKVSRFWFGIWFLKLIGSAMFKRDDSLAKDDVRGLSGWLAQHALLSVMLNGVLSLLALGLHVWISILVWKTQGLWIGIATAVFMGLSEGYWLWQWNHAGTLTTLQALACVGVIAVTFVWRHYYKKAARIIASKQPD